MTRHFSPVNPPIPELGAALRRYREDRGIKAKDIAAQAGFSASYMSEIENGRRGLTRSVLKKVAKAIGEDCEVLQSELRILAEKQQFEESIVVNDDVATYRAKVRPDPLLGMLLKEMEDSQLRDLAHRLIDQAIDGDDDAKERVVQLVRYLPSEKVS